MCVGLDLAGYPRYAEPRAEFMVHAPRMAENGHMTMWSTQAMVQLLVSLGASPAWIQRVTAAGGFSGARDYRETAGRLNADGASIVTDLLRWRSAHRPQDRSPPRSRTRALTIASHARPRGRISSTENTPSRER